MVNELQLVANCSVRSSLASVRRPAVLSATNAEELASSRSWRTVPQKTGSEKTGVVMSFS